MVISPVKNHCFRSLIFSLCFVGILIYYFFICFSFHWCYWLSCIIADCCSHSFLLCTWLFCFFLCCIYLLLQIAIVGRVHLTQGKGFLVKDQRDAQILFYVFIFIYNSLHVSSTSCSSSGERNCINTASGNSHSILVVEMCAGCASSNLHTSRPPT